MQAAMTACHDAAYREAFIAGLSALHVLITWSLGTRTLTNKQAADLKNAYGALMQAAKGAAKPRWNGHSYDPPLISHECSEELRATAKQACIEMITQFGGTP
jgi:hypothetical protein